MPSLGEAARLGGPEVQTATTATGRLADPGLDGRWLRGEPGALEEAHRRYREEWNTRKVGR